MGDLTNPLEDRSSRGSAFRKRQAMIRSTFVVEGPLVNRTGFPGGS